MEQDPIDPQALEELRELEEHGAKGIVRRVISIFLEDTPKALSSLRVAAERLDAKTLMRTAHGLKSACASIGATALSGLCRELELLGRADSLEGAAQRISEIEGEFDRVRVALEARL